VKTIFGKRNVRCDGPVLAHSTNFITLISQKIITPPCRGAEYCNECVCLSVCLSACLSAIISSELHVRSSPFLVNATYGRGSVLLVA